MKSFIMSFFSVLMWIISKVYPYRLCQRLHSVRDILYTMWIRNFIGKVGKNVVIHNNVSFYGLKKIYIGVRL